MNSYIVRVYRRNHGASEDELAGLIEEVGTDTRTSFQSISGLIKTLRQMIGNDVPAEADVSALFPENSVVNLKTALNPDK